MPIIGNYSAVDQWAVIFLRYTLTIEKKERSGYSVSGSFSKYTRSLTSFVTEIKFFN